MLAAMLEVLGTGLVWLSFVAVVFLLCSLITAFGGEDSKEFYAVTSVKTALIVGLVASWKQGWSTATILLLVVVCVIAVFELGFGVFVTMPELRQGVRKGLGDRLHPKHWLKIASVEWRHIQSVAREEVGSSLPDCNRILAAARGANAGQPLEVTQELDAHDGSELVPQDLLGKLTRPLQAYANEYSLRLVREWEGAASFRINQAKVSSPDPATDETGDRREEALRKCLVAWTEVGLKEAAGWWLAEEFDVHHMPSGIDPPVHEMAKIALSAPDSVDSETRASAFSKGLKAWISEQHADLSTAALPLVLTIEPHYNFNAESFNAHKKAWLNRMTAGFAWALIGDAVPYETLTLPNQSNYEGEHRNGEPHGFGNQTWPDGKRYEGEFRNGKPHGHGTLVFEDGIRLESRWRRGRSRGGGAMTMPDRTCYEGERRFGKRHGRWTVTTADGRQHVSRWFYGKRIG